MMPGLDAVAIQDSCLPTPALTTDSGTPSMSSMDALTEERVTIPPLQRELVYDLATTRTELKRVLSEPCGSTKRRPRTCVSNVDQPTPAKPAKCRLSSHATTSTAVSKSTNVSADLRKVATLRLKPQTYKLSRGQLVVLPSKALLVDFRESERRKGHEGKQVLVVDANGDTVHDTSMVLCRRRRTLTTFPGRWKFTRLLI